MIKGVKCPKPKTEPKQKPKTLRQLILEGFDKINNRLDNVDNRLDKQEEFSKQTSMLIRTVIKLNNLKTK